VPDPIVLSFEEFWSWLKGHPNCVLSAGTVDTVIFDHDDFHWTFSEELNPEGHDEMLVQALRGKQLVAEILIPRGRIIHVQGEARDQEFVFECFEEDDGGPVASYFVALSHGYDPEEHSETQGWVH